MWGNWKRPGWRKSLCAPREHPHASLHEQWKILLSAVLLVCFFAWFFYRSAWAVPFLTPLGVWYWKHGRNMERIRQQEQLRVQFREAIRSLAANLRAGYAVENAARETLHDLERLYGKRTPIYRSWNRIVVGLGSSVSMEQLLQEFAQQSGAEEIEMFADVFGAARRSGGNLVEIIQSTAERIAGKIEVDEEIRVLLAARRMEQRIMCVIPFGIVLYVSAASPGFFRVLYEGIVGPSVMTVCLLLFLASWAVGQKLVNIQV